VRCEPRSWGRGGRGVRDAASVPLFPTTPLVSPSFPHVPLGVGGWPVGYEERKVLSYVSVQLVSKISDLCDPDPPTLQTDRQTVGQTDDMQSQYRALH